LSGFTFALFSQHSPITPRSLLTTTVGLGSAAGIYKILSDWNHDYQSTKPIISSPSSPLSSSSPLSTVDQGTNKKAEGGGGLSFSLFQQYDDFKSNIRNRFTPSGGRSGGEEKSQNNSNENSDVKLSKKKE
jgi:hypothetical protein